MLGFSIKNEGSRVLVWQNTLFIPATWESRLEHHDSEGSLDFVSRSFEKQKSVFYLEILISPNLQGGVCALRSQQRYEFKNSVWESHRSKTVNLAYPMGTPVTVLVPQSLFCHLSYKML